MARLEFDIPDVNKDSDPILHKGVQHWSQIWAQNEQDWHQMGHIWDFLRSGYRIGEINVLKTHIKNPQICPNQAKT